MTKTEQALENASQQFEQAPSTLGAVQLLFVSMDSWKAKEISDEILEQIRKDVDTWMSGGD